MKNCLTCLYYEYDSYYGNTCLRKKNIIEIIKDVMSDKACYNKA